MLQTFSSLEETADRFRRNPEFIWKLSLQFPNLLRPELGNNGLVVYSDQQRQVIGRIIKMRDQGMTDAEIARSFDDPSATAPASHTKNSPGPCSDDCRKNFLILAGQVKTLWKQLRLLQSELETLRQFPDTTPPPLEAGITTNPAGMLATPGRPTN